MLPEARDWPGMMLGFAARRPPHAGQFRRELGLPTDRPIVMTGHQAQFWHPGILAKYLAADALAARTGGSAAWIVVDQDVNPLATIRLPVKRADGAPGGRLLRVETWTLTARAGAEPGDVPTGRRAAFTPTPLPDLEAGEAWAAPAVGAGAHAIRSALADHTGAPSAAAQVARACGDLLAPLMHRPGLPVFALALNRTSLFQEIVQRMRQDPAACTRAYNGAVESHPRERIQPLRPDELPLWNVSPEFGSPRRRVTLSDLGGLSTVNLAPRALLMTGLFRCAGCDLFIHGTGGGGGAGIGAHDGYDRITEQWLGEWLGGEMNLAPSVVATATVRLAMNHHGPGPAELRRAQWTAHRARHEPALLGDPAADQRKRDLVAEIRRLKRAGGGARDAYRAMHALLERSRETHAANLVALQSAADSAALRLGDADIAADRTWAFPLYEADQLADLRGRIQAAMR